MVQSGTHEIRLHVTRGLLPLLHSTLAMSSSALLCCQRCSQQPFCSIFAELFLIPSSLRSSYLHHSPFTRSLYFLLIHVFIPFSLQLQLLTSLSWITQIYSFILSTQSLPSVPRLTNTAPALLTLITNSLPPLYSDTNHTPLLGSQSTQLPIYSERCGLVEWNISDYRPHEGS